MHLVVCFPWFCCIFWYPGGKAMHGGVGVKRGTRWGQGVEGREQRAAETKTIQQEGQRLVVLFRQHAQASNSRCYTSVTWMLVVGVFVRQNCGGRWGAACGLKTPAYTSISTAPRRWWIQRRISTRKPAQPADMNSLTRRCRHGPTPQMWSTCRATPASFPPSTGRYLFFYGSNKTIT